MQSGAKWAIGGTLVFLAVVGARVGMIYRERNAPEKPVAAPARPKIADDDLVFLKKKRQSSMADAKELNGSAIWVSAGGQMEFYPAAGKRVDYAKVTGTLLGAQKLEVKDFVEQTAPKSATHRVPGGDRQVLMLFTLPASENPAKQYGVPVGYHESGQYTFYLDEIFFYDDPHELYKHWGSEIWKAVDSHVVILGMSERETQLALGQVSKSLSNDYGNRLVVYANLGKPIAVTFIKNKATAFRPDQGF
ncbi:hypothetical protein [Edaphobacter modestus]|uniref:Uncharacterized protein n=1 Tax=Edaphobacter modestus TaxID=388466 RepID=A0A4Q7YWH2_9BACT|nr:hypothetical protein [Edaphobacter modestus]RZU41399.1 hypothetical protein BDD14_2921 [Edaphobacter modestus]